MDEIKIVQRFKNEKFDKDSTKGASNLQLCPLIPEHQLFACLPWVAKVMIITVKMVKTVKMVEMVEMVEMKTRMDRNW